MKILIILLFGTFLLAGCIDSNPNTNRSGDNILEQKEIKEINVVATYRDTVYIPIYSDIYSETRSSRINLTATLSIRNTSLRDSIYIENIDYYDTSGNLVEEYLQNPIVLTPLQSLDYVIEKDNTIGGSGANFIVNWAANNPKVRPVFQGVMIGGLGQKGISFTTEGVSIVSRD